MRIGMTTPVLVALLVAIGATQARVTRPTVSGVTNLATIESTIACAGATTPAAVAELKKLGYASIISLRRATEAGADIDAEAAAAKEAGLRFVHLPFDGASPDPSVVDRFLTAVVEPANQPVFVHCASGNRAAMMWMIKRMVLDGWDEARASAEASALGLTSPALKKFALEYAAAHSK